MVETAEEYTKLKEFNKALTLFNHVIWDYRREKWWNLVNTLLAKALALAYVTVSRSGLIRVLVEYLGPNFKDFLGPKRDELQVLLDDVLAGACPRWNFDVDVELELGKEVLLQAREKWRRCLAKPVDQPILLDMTPIVGLWEVSCHFEKGTYSLDDVVRVGVHVR